MCQYLDRPSPFASFVSASTTHFFLCLYLYRPLAALQDLAHTLRTRLAGLPRFAAPKRAQHAFAVDHYAGEVVYSTEHLMDKNKVGRCPGGAGCTYFESAR